MIESPLKYESPSTFLPKDFFLKKVGATGPLLNLLCPESGAWEVGLRLFFVGCRMINDRNASALPRADMDH